MNSTFASLASTLLDNLAGRYNQHRRVLTLSTPLGDSVLLAEHLRATEELSEGYSLEVSALSLDAAIPLRSLIGQPVLVELQTAATAAPRPFHGHVTTAKLVGSNGGFARYHITVEPWLTFLGIGRDSRVFHDATVFDILDTVFQGYAGKGKLVPAWRFDIRDRRVYQKRSLTTQYQESNLAFVRRLMFEEGLFYFFEHAGDATGAELGSHTLVIADHNGAFAPNAQPEVRFTQPGAVMREDSIDRWRTEMRIQTNAVEVASWDYRSRSIRSASAETGTDERLTSRDAPGAYAYPTMEQGERIAENQLQALQVRRERHTGAGTVRTFAPGTTFALHGHSAYDGGDDAKFTIIRALHMAHNNLDAGACETLTGILGRCALEQANSADLASSIHAVGRGAGQRPVYRNRIDAISSRIPYRACATDGAGKLLHPRPVVRGQQTAIVVGPPGAFVHTDRDHRVKVQFHWQRGQDSHSRLLAPESEGQPAATAEDMAGTWVRVATPLAPVAGSNWGSHALPRVGQEVLVDFLDGNIDRPVVIGAVYNAVGQANAQHSEVGQGAGRSTGNAPAWFPGSEGAHAHPAVLSGIKSQALKDSQSGAGGSSQLVFDDSAGDARVALQQHAASHEGTSELNLGHLRHQSDNQRHDRVGFGAELKTAHQLALRAGGGMLVTADRASTGSDQLDVAQAAAQIEQSTQMLSDLAATAGKHNAELPDRDHDVELTALRHMRRSAQTVHGRAEGGTLGQSGGSGNAVSFSEPHLQLSSPAGIAAVTPASAVIRAGASTTIAAGHAVNFASQAGWFSTAAKGMTLFTYGKAGTTAGPVAETGIRLHAASGKFSAQSQAGPMRLTSDKTVTVASVTKQVNVGAKSHLLMTVQGAFLKIEGGNIMLHGPGKIEFRSSARELKGPSKSEAPKITFPSTVLHIEPKRGYAFSR